MAKAAIMGYGTVGSGVYEILKMNAARLEESAGEKIELKYILDIRDFDDHPEKHLFTKDVNDIINDKEIDVVAEVMGGLHPAYEFTKELLSAGKSVVTSNKELVATYGSELLETAKKNNVNYMFEASVGGGIPIIRPLNRCLAANNIIRIAGILNGTTNYILYQMITNDKSFEDALKDAQANGYAERNPAADIEGHDACRKIAILSSLAWGKEVDYSSISTEGIVNISLEDVHYASSIGCSVKLIGYAQQLKSGKIYAHVAPMLIKKGCMLAGIDDVYNGILVKGDAVGDVMFYGAGAGKLPTASAVVADMLDSVIHKERRALIGWVKSDEDVCAGEDDMSFEYFVRTSDPADKVADIFGEVELLRSLADNETAFITSKLTASELRSKTEKLSEVISAIRIFA